MPEPGAGEVLLRIECVGICGSDIEYYRHFQCGAFTPREPFVLGHEFCGIIEKIGHGVTHIALGSRAVVEPSISCATCRYCLEGHYNLCDNMRFYGSASAYPHLNGGFREYLTAPIRNLHVLPAQFSAAEGALLEPLAVAVHALRRARPLDNNRLLIIGGGTIGQLLAMAARAYGAASITLSDPIAAKRAFAQEHAADETLDPAATDLPPPA